MLRFLYCLRFLLCCALLPFAAHGEQLPQSLLPLTEEQIRAAGVETQPVEPEPGIGELVVPGFVVVPPQQLRIVAAPAAGLVETLLVAPDQDVKEGDPIATLKSSDLIEAQRAFLHALSGANLAAEKLRRDEQLFKEHIIAERRLIVTRAEAAQARATLDERAQILALVGMAESEIDALRRDRKLASSLLVRAPIGGTILQRHGTTGERVQAAAPLVTIARLDPIWVNLQVPLSRSVALNSVEKVYLPSAGLEGKLIRVGRTVEFGDPVGERRSRVQAGTSSVAAGAGRPGDLAGSGRGRLAVAGSGGRRG